VFGDRLSRLSFEKSCSEFLGRLAVLEGKSGEVLEDGRPQGNSENLKVEPAAAQTAAAAAAQPADTSSAAV